MTSETGTEQDTYLETSRGGALMVELDATGAVVRVQIEPEVNASWSADTLSERLLFLHHLALMRVRCAQRQRMNELGADMAPSDVYPSEDEIAGYRARNINF
jgi:DNA-binding protein YbaB